MVGLWVVGYCGWLGAAGGRWGERRQRLQRQKDDTFFFIFTVVQKTLCKVRAA